MKKITICLFGCFLFFTSCKTILSKKYRVNQKFSFTSSAEYLDYLQKVKGFDLSHVIFPDTTTVNAFIGYILQKELVEYYGSLINDSTEVKKSQTLQDNLSCMGRVINEINTNKAINSFNDTSLLAKNEFHNFNFRFISSKEKFDLNRSTKPLKIILLYAYSYGTFFDEFLNEMNKFSQQQGNNAEVYIISLDYPFYFK